MRITVFILLFCIQFVANACSPAERPPFFDLIREGRSVVIVTPTEIRAPRPLNTKADDPEDIIIHFLSPITAKVRIVELLLGLPVSLEEVSYFHTWCAGHRFEVDRYYVLVVDALKQHHEIVDNELLGLGNEYLEQKGAQHSPSLLIKEILNYKENGQFNMDSIKLRPYREITLPKIESPSYNSSR